MDRVNRRNKILIDANPLVGAKSGVGHFTYRLIESLATAYPEDLDIICYYFNFGGRKRIGSLPRGKNIYYKEVRFLPTKLINILHRFKLQLPLEIYLGPLRHIDRIIFPNFVATPTIAKIPYAVAVHDMSFLDHPEYLTDGNRAYLKLFVPRSIKNSALVITISKFTRERIISAYGATVLKKKILVLPIPYEPKQLSQHVSERIIKLKVAPYFLFVGTIEPRKNIANLIRAFELFKQNKHNDTKLIIAGGYGWKNQEVYSLVANSIHKKDIHFLGYVNDSERDYLYRNAVALCLVSHYEGFGMPILEALHYKKQLILSDIPVFREVAGDNAIYCDPTNLDSIAKALENSLRQQRKIQPYASTTWQDNARSLVESLLDIGNA